MGGAPGGRSKGRLTRIRLLWAKVASETATAEEDHGTFTSPFPPPKYISKATITSSPFHLFSSLTTTQKYTISYKMKFSIVSLAVLAPLVLAQSTTNTTQYLTQVLGALTYVSQYFLCTPADFPVVPVLPRSSASLLRLLTPPTALRSLPRSPRATRPSLPRTT